MKTIICIIAACLLSSCIILPYGHEGYWGHGHERWGDGRGWHGEGRWH
jgi:hypothetical protein